MAINGNGAPSESQVSGIVRAVNDKGLRLDGYDDEQRAREKARKRAWYLKNREQVLARVAAQRARLGTDAVRAYHKEYRRQNAERLRAKRQKYYQKNRARLDAYNDAWRVAHGYMRGYYERNKDRLAARTARYKRENKEAVNFWNKRRQIAKRGAPVNDFTRGQWDALKRAYGHRCAYCGKPFERLTQDHVIPLSRQGAHTVRNIVPACRPCNARKFTGPPLPISVLPLWSDLVAIWTRS